MMNDIIDEDVVFKNRIQEDDKYLRRLHRLHAALPSAMEVTDMSNLQPEVLEYLLDVDNYHHYLSKFSYLNQTNDKDVADLLSQIQTIKYQSQCIHDDIERELENISREKRNILFKDELNALADKIAKFPSKSVLHENINLLNQEIEALENAQKKVREERLHKKKEVTEFVKNSLRLNASLEQQN